MAADTAGCYHVLTVAFDSAYWFTPYWYDSCSLECCLAHMSSLLKFGPLLGLGQSLGWVHTEYHGLIICITVLGGGSRFCFPKAALTPFFSVFSVSAMPWTCFALQSSDGFSGELPAFCAEMVIKFREWKALADDRLCQCMWHSSIRHPQAPYFSVHCCKQLMLLPSACCQLFCSGSSTVKALTPFSTFCPYFSCRCFIISGLLCHTFCLLHFLLWLYTARGRWWINSRISVACKVCFARHYHYYAAIPSLGIDHVSHNSEANLGLAEQTTCHLSRNTQEAVNVLTIHTLWVMHSHVFSVTHQLETTWKPVMEKIVKY